MKLLESAPAWKVIQHQLQTSIQKQMWINAVVKCNIEPGIIIDLQDALFESLEEDE